MRQWGVAEKYCMSGLSRTCTWPARQYLGLQSEWLIGPRYGRGGVISVDTAEPLFVCCGDEHQAVPHVVSVGSWWKVEWRFALEHLKKEETTRSNCKWNHLACMHILDWFLPKLVQPPKLLSSQGHCWFTLLIQTHFTLLHTWPWLSPHFHCALFNYCK